MLVCVWTVFFHFFSVCYQYVKIFHSWRLLGVHVTMMPKMLRKQKKLLKGFEDDFVCLVWPCRGKLCLLTSLIQKRFCSHVKTRCPPAQNGNETPVDFSSCSFNIWDLERMSFLFFQCLSLLNMWHRHIPRQCWTMLHQNLETLYKGLTWIVISY